MPEQAERDRAEAGGPIAGKRPYQKPELRQLGHMADVTRKSGGNLDGGNPNQKTMP